ncbi:hypothetical protein GC175_26330 [bacterium]|nr:hypothetical protein [bacterium]
MPERDTRLNYTSLDADRIVTTVERLTARIGERFPQSSLYNLSQQVITVAHKARDEAREIPRPIIWVRLATALLILALAGLIVVSFLVVEAPVGTVNLIDYLQAVESLINDAFFIGAAVFFLARRETHLKQQRALKALHKLRSLAHIVDMHQLTKDPEGLRPQTLLTPASPRHELTPFELGRYLDYCSEMLSLLGKLAALYVQDFDNPVVLASVNEIESLTTGLSRKIWQKLMVLQQGRTAQ